MKAMNGFNTPKEAFSIPRDFGSLCQSVFTGLRDHINIEKAFLDSWKALNVEYIDMFLIHWSQARGPNGGFSA